MLQLREIIKDFGGRRLFAGISWHLRPGDKVGLCGENGAGKTTLLKVLAGQVPVDVGEVQIARGTTCGYLPQDGLEHRGRSLFAEVRTALAELLAMERELGELEAAIAERHLPADLDRYATVQETFRQRGGYEMETEIAKVLRGLGFAEGDWEKPCEHFSGGWQMRIALARLLLQRPNLLLLDEPTNHLDLPARDWLEAYLASYPGAVVLVSHDRFFLDQVVGRIVEVWNGSLTEYPGNYSRYLEERERRVNALQEAKRRQDEEIERTEAFIGRFRYQANKASLVQSRIKQLEKIVRIDVPPPRRKIFFRFPDPPKGGRLALELTGIRHGYNERTVLDGIDLTVEKGERIALVGANGAGKSTLMRLLAGVEAPRAGKRTPGHNLQLAYFAQDQAKVLDASRTVLEEITSAAPMAMVPRVRDILGTFLFSGDDVHKRVAVLSGGERNRLALAILLLRPANLLLLDEPTNHLDLASKEVLLASLQHYAGTLVFVSHDRYFVDALATRVIEVGGGAATSWLGNYEDFLSAKAAAGEGGHSQQRVEALVGSSSDGVPLDREDRRRQHEERKEAQRLEKRRQKELAELEGAIEEAEGALATVEAAMADPALYADVEGWRKASSQHAALQEKIGQLYRRWEEVQEELAMAKGA
ncbi:ABC-F family ATP-binding cassette domain-containing protein [Desulfuromonas carbonis]|uniref:ABC-F family ATP-binding cassette domain-containing protein n=1 Tax=Desulfuromonas sp. DDH964 TaxID=1823759 RepID=UPI00078BB50A|nr:ABC-F family ATP-binding cassette domain-containing protein [Desulfuromonas sp. DDH964]AMV72960.1 ABC transporter ATP-binding protein [Desulfuromonas sp. DDH964]